MISSLFFFSSISILLKLIIIAGMVGMYLYAKVSPHKDQLDAKHRGYYDTADKFFGGLSRTLGNGVKPYQIGPGVFLDMGQFILFLVMALIAMAMMMGM